MDDTDMRAEQCYRESEALRYPRFRDNLIDKEWLVETFPDRQDRENYLGMEFDSLVDREIEEIKSRPGKFANNLLIELNIRAAEVTFANDNTRGASPEPWRGKLDPMPEGPPRTPERER